MDLKLLASQKHVKIANPIYGQLIIGPPGSGKTTYCNNMNEFFKKINRKVTLVNLDPANENMLYKPAIDIMELITVQDVMEHMKLGPNGALIYCMEYLEKNFDWFLKKLNEQENKYFIFDCPGQIELYTHHTSVREIFSKLTVMNYHLCAVHLVDSHYCSEPSKFISALLMSLSVMLQVGLPHVNVLSKADLLHHHESNLMFNVDFYTDVLDLQQLLSSLEEDMDNSKYTKLNTAMISLIEDYSLVSFHLLNVNDDESILKLKNVIDKVNGYVFGAGEERSIQSLLACAFGAKPNPDRFEDFERNTNEEF
uniref:GPN-loop GTPase 2 n=1 Tax=Xenopsylla cheopis TaxID=163159 RepID=A0A6M2DI93_XENCH